MLVNLFMQLQRIVLVKLEIHIDYLLTWEVLG